MPAKKVTIGSIVLWRPRHDDWAGGVSGVTGAEYDDYRIAAIVTRVHENGRVDLKAFVNDESRPVWRTYVSNDLTVDNGSGHFFTI